MVVILIALLLAGCAKDSGKDIRGIWEGKLKFPGIEMRVIFKISRMLDGTYTAIMLRPELGDQEIPLSKVILDDNHLQMEIVPGQVLFDGYLRLEESAIIGKWNEGEFTQPLALKKVKEVYKPQRPQEPTPPYPYDEEEVVYENTKARCRLAGTLTLPREGCPCPAVLLISGGGAQNRDGLILEHRPFLVLADYLTRRGIAVLRVDDRGIGASTGDRSQATSEDYAQDALAGIEFLKKHPEIDPKRIGLIGHSEGSIIASLVSAQSQDIAFIVMLAGPGLPGEEYNYQFEKSINRVLGRSEETIDSIIALQKRIFAVLKSEKDTEKARAKLRQILENLEPPMPEDAIQVNLKRYLSPWFRYSITYDPAPVLHKVKCPVLALFGEKDVHVPHEGNFEGVKQALKNAGNPDYRVELLPDLNHLFQTAPTGAPSEYARIEETIAPKVLELIGSWILEHSKK
jgi:pimeloyl-ACP methyl ester carboxylesterase